jgi:uncharacterized membrane protein
VTEPFALAPPTVGVVLAMAAVTYLTKAGGLWALGHVDLPDGAETALDALPGAVVVSILAPALATAGPPAWLAAAVVVLVDPALAGEFAVHRVVFLLFGHFLVTGDGDEDVAQLFCSICVGL